MRRAIVTVAMCTLMPAAIGEQKPASVLHLREGTRLVTEPIYAFAVMENGTGYCLPSNDEGIDVIWNVVSEEPDLLKDVNFQSNRLPEEAYLVFLMWLFFTSMTALQSNSRLVTDVKLPPI